jgi:hypothetical protein
MPSGSIGNMEVCGVEAVTTVRIMGSVGDNDEIL